MKRVSVFLLDYINAITVCFAGTVLLFEYVGGRGDTQSGYEVLAYHIPNGFHPLYFCLFLMLVCIWFGLRAILERSADGKRKLTRESVVALVLLCGLYMVLGVCEKYSYNLNTTMQPYQTQAVIPFILACSLYAFVLFSGLLNTEL